MTVDKDKSLLWMVMYLFNKVVYIEGFKGIVRFSEVDVDAKFAEINESGEITYFVKTSNGTGVNAKEEKSSINMSFTLIKFVILFE